MITHSPALAIVQIALRRTYEAELARGRAMSRAGDWQAALFHLGRAHILGQHQFSRHWRVHCALLALGLRQGDGREVLGQLFRLALVPVAHLGGVLPVGNPGHAAVDAFAVMPIPDELLSLLERDARLIALASGSD